MDSKTYQWHVPDNDVPRLGKIMEVVGPVRPEYHETSGPSLILMQPLYQTTCEWVRASDLTEYIGGRE